MGRLVLKHDTHPESSNDLAVRNVRQATDYELLSTLFLSTCRDSEIIFSPLIWMSLRSRAAIFATHFGGPKTAELMQIEMMINHVIICLHYQYHLYWLWLYRYATDDEANWLVINCVAGAWHFLFSTNRPKHRNKRFCVQILPTD